jgi:hypothetical protein
MPTGLNGHAFGKLFHGLARIPEPSKALFPVLGVDPFGPLPLWLQ